MFPTFCILCVIIIHVFSSDISGDSDSYCDGDICHENEANSYYISEASDFDDNALIPTEFRVIQRPAHVLDENQQLSINFHNLCDEDISLFWLNGDSERPNGNIQVNSAITIGTFIGHKFFYRLNSQLDTKQRLQITTINRDVADIYLKDPEVQRKELMEFEAKRSAFKQQYFDKTGLRWIAYYPRDPPKLHMFDAEFVGQKHEVSSNHSFYNCYPQTEKEEDVMTCRDDKELVFEWKIQSTSPKVMSLEPAFLSDFEMEHVIHIANMSLNRSTIGQDEYIQVSGSRTSKGAWIQRHSSEVIDWIFKRIADVTKIDEAHLWPSYGCEQLQVLKYDVGEQFHKHPDYNTNKKGMRFLTFLMYLNDVEEGGETEFPKVNLKVTPQKGHVAAFYSALEDGNADSRSIHAGLPIKKGVKWAAPLWIWDPYFER